MEPKVSGLESFLSQATRTATEARLNIDQMPTSFTVLDRQMIERTGAVTVADLLRFVPGVEIIREGNGSYHVLIRGNYSDRRVLILWDGQPLNVLLTRRAFQFIGYLPVDILERVEISRGPSSSVYGSYAVGGVINLIPRKWEQGGEIGAAYGSFATSRGFAGAGFTKGDFSLQFSVGALNSKGERFTAVDAVGKPGPVKLANDNNWQEIRLTWKGLKAKLFRFDIAMPHYYEISDRLSRSPYPKTRINYLGGHLSYLWQIKPWWHFNTYVNWRQDFIDYGVLYMLNADDPIFAYLPGTPYGQPIWAKEKAHLREIIYGFWNAWNFNEHHLKIGLEFLENGVRSSYFASNISFPQLIPLPSITPQHPPWPKVSERMWALYLQDEWSLDSKNEINFGLRFDKYKGFSGEFSPRLVWIHRFSTRFITKLIYGHGFRVPDLDALYDNHYPFVWGNPDLRPEKLDSIESVVIFHPSTRQRISLSLFRMWLRDVLGRRMPGGIGGWSFQQGGDEDVWGGEITWRYRGEQWDLYLFGSYQWGKNEFDEPRPYVANVLAGGVVSYSFTHIPLEIDLSCNYVGPRWREKYNLARGGTYVPDLRSRLKSYHLFNLKIRYELNAKVQLWLGITNLFDNDIRYPSTYINGVGIKDDYRGQGRYAEVGVRLRF